MNMHLGKSILYDENPVDVVPHAREVMGKWYSAGNMMLPALLQMLKLIYSYEGTKEINSPYCRQVDYGV